MVTIGKLARSVGLSRSTLLYYDSIGLVSPSARSKAGYRLYSEKDKQRLELVLTYRRAGIPLKEIEQVIDRSSSTVVKALEKRLLQLNQEIAALRQQQRVVVGLLKNRHKLKRTRTLDKAHWVELLRATGLSDADMDRWHIEFERLSPQGHQDFLESLGIGNQEIKKIRSWAKQGVG